MDTPRGDDTPFAPDDEEEEAILERASAASGAREEAEWLASLTPDERALYESLLGAYQRDWLDQMSEAERAALSPEELARIETQAAPERPVAPPSPIEEPDF